LKSLIQQVSEVRSEHELLISQNIEAHEQLSALNTQIEACRREVKQSIEKMQKELDAALRKHNITLGQVKEASAVQVKLRQLGLDLDTVKNVTKEFGHGNQ